MGFGILVPDGEICEIKVVRRLGPFVFIVEAEHEDIALVETPEWEHGRRTLRVVIDNGPTVEVGISGITIGSVTLWHEEKCTYVRVCD
jgi:hypothetical protein